jgi:hypothetical protein
LIAANTMIITPTALIAAAGHGYLEGEGLVWQTGIPIQGREAAVFQM